MPFGRTAHVEKAGRCIELDGTADAVRRVGRAAFEVRTARESRREVWRSRDRDMVVCERMGEGRRSGVKNYEGNTRALATKGRRLLSQLMSRSHGNLFDQTAKRRWSSAAAAVIAIGPSSAHAPPTPTIELQLYIIFHLTCTMINAFLVFNGSGQPRLTKFYTQLVCFVVDARAHD